MGTAPPDDQQPKMPDPVRLMRRSVLLLRRLGMSEPDALTLVADVARTVRFRLYLHATGQGTWLSHIVNAAEDRFDSLAQSRTDSKGNEHADGSSS